MQETLNAKLRNRVQPLFNSIEIMKKMNEDGTTEEEKKVMLKFLLDKKNIESLENFVDFLIK